MCAAVPQLPTAGAFLAPENDVLARPKRRLSMTPDTVRLVVPHSACTLHASVLSHATPWLLQVHKYVCTIYVPDTEGRSAITERATGLLIGPSLIVCPAHIFRTCPPDAVTIEFLPWVGTTGSGTDAATERVTLDVVDAHKDCVAFVKPTVS